MGQIKVDLMFSADTSSAINNIQQLSQLLSQISTTTTIGVDGGAIQSAVSAAQQLQIHLQNAVNVNTGKIDLSKLNASLKSANTDLKTLMGNLQAAGPTGQQAFLKVATAIAQAEAPMMRVNQRLKDFGTTLLNTIKWQVASTMIHGVSEMLSAATQHAEELNTALNEIRIVTGKSSDDMAKFAMEASSAAKELSTTTTEYAKAALIFYQQGLEGSEVTDRADVVIKLAQVTGQSAQIVSDQMTAIWNNFDDGSKSLEYYADVLTRLGAETAASTDEIAQGMEKFAAIGETVGLSYEYAAASVATVVDKTRQSADVVGTSFKTIFARMQGLSLGETLEDGVDLNKYSEALASVGINVLDASGEMRKMDDILDELGAKWDGFGETTQIALAQTVGGVRQYNQMIALMDNWDSVTENINKAKEATGELAKQQAIWSDSYEGAANRVKQAQNELYEKFIDDEAIVKLTDMFANLIDGVSGFIDSLGGVGPMLLMLVGIFSKSLFPMVQAGFKTLMNNISVLTGKAQMDMTRIQAETSQQMTAMMSQSGLTEGQKQQIEITQKLLNAKKELAVASKHMSLAQQEEAKAAMQNYEAMAAQTQQALERKAQLEQEIQLLKEKMNAGSAKKTVAATAAFDVFRKEKGPEEEAYADAVIADASDSSRSIASTKKELSSFDTPAGDGSADSVAKKEMVKTLNEQIIAQEQRIAEIIAQDQSAPGSEDEAKTLELLAQEEIKLEALKEDQANIDELLEERKKHLTDVLRLQEDIAKESKKDIKDIAVDEVSSSAFSDSFYGEGKDTVDLGRGMTNNIASKLTKGTDANTGEAKSAEVVGGTDTTIGNVVADASLANLEQLYTLMGQYKTQISELTAMETDLAQMDFSYIAEETAAQQELETSTTELKAAKQDYQKIVKKEGPDSEKAKKALTQLQKAEDKYKSSLEKSNKAKDKAKKAGKDYGKALDSLKKKINDMAKAAGQSDDDLKELNQAFEDLKNGTDAGAALDIIKNKLGTLKTATTAADGSLDQMAVSMRESLMGAGFSGAQLDSMIAKLQELGIITPDIANKIRVLNEQGDRLGGQGPTKGQQIASTITTIGTVAGTVAMSVSALSGTISTMMNPDASGMEKAISLLMTLSTLLPTVATAVTFLSAVMKAKNALEEQGIAITGKNIAAQLVEMGVISAKTATTWGNTIANIANLLSNPWTMALAAVALVAIAGVCIGLGVYTKNTEAATEAQLAQNEATMESAEKANELSAKWAEQQDAMDELIGKYKELKAAGDDYSGTVDDIIAAVPDLIAAYHDAANGLGIDIGEGSDFAAIEQRMKNAAAVGDVEAVEAAQNEMDNLISPEAAKKAQEGYTAAVNTLGTTLTQTQGSITDNKYSVHVGGADSWFDAGNEEADSVDILHRVMGSKATDEGNGSDITLDMSTNDQFMADYEKLMEARDAIASELDAEALSESDTYREIDELLKNSEEQYNKAKEMQAEADKYGVYDAKANLEKQGMDITEIDSLKEYQEYRDALLNDPNVKGDPQAEAIARQWLEANANVEEYVKAEQKIGYVRDQAGDEAADKLMDLYDGKNKKFGELTDQQKELFLEVDFTKYQTEEAVMSEIDRLQGIADQEEIQVKLTAINTAQSSLKESGMTQEDWTNIQNSGIDWGNEEAGIIEFTDFLKMSYSEQQAYLQQMETAQNEALVESAQATKASLEANLANLDKNSATYAQDKQLIEEQIEAEESRLAILEKTAKAQMWEDQGLNAGEVEEYASALEELPLVETREEAEAIAAANMRMNKGIDALAEGWEEWGAALKSGNKSSQQYAAALKGVKTAVADVLDTDTDQFTDDFLTSAETLGLLEKVAQGDMEALAELQQQAALNVTGQIKIDTNQTELQSQLDSINSWITDFPDLEIGASLDSTGMTAAFQALLDSGAMTVDQMNAILNNIGFEPEITYKEMTVAEAKAAKQTAYLKTDTGEYTQVTDEVKLQDDAKVWVPVINGKNTSYQGPPKTSLNQKKDGGGGGGDKKKADKAKKSDTVERYKEITDALDDNADAMDKASRAADRLYGKDRLAKMREANKLLQKEIDLTKQKKKEAENYLKIDKAELDAMAAEAGVSFTYDSKGNISNYEEEMTKLFNELDSAINKANADGNADENEQKEIDAIQEKIDKVKDAMSTYEDTRELIEDLDTELEEKLYEWQDANFEILNTELELKIEINDMDLQRLEYYLGKMEDDFYQMAEAAALMVMNANGDGFGGQLTSYMDQLQHQEDYLDKLRKQYEAGEISQANYIEGLKNASSAIYEQLGSLQELDATMMEYYSETLAAAGEEIAKYTELMENATGVLDHYASIAEMLGKSTDYKYMGKILQAQADVASNAYKVSKANYEMLKKQEDERKQAYDDAVARNASESELEMLEKQWWDARAAANEAQDTMLSDVETWAEALRAVLDNSIADFGQELENTLTAGYGSFDAMTSAFERKNALQEEYLTTTNKIYETNKMMRTAQQEIDKTTNEAAKRRLKQFINETDALQDQSKLSQYELEIQQAKYDLLLAEIALEEAQNAKSTVRLQRDNEGNMSYVYTADQNKIADAQQKVEDAQNALYNKGLEGANDYVQKYQETMQEMYDALTEIQQNYLDGAYESEEEYNNAIEEAKEYYYEKLTQYSNLYQVALTTDTRVAADAWTTEFASMTENTEDWMTAVNGYVGDVQGAFATWKSQMDTIEKETLGNMDETLSNIVSDSEDLAETVTDEVVPALEAEMNAVKDVTDKYATFRETLESITKEYEEMAKAAENAIKVANGLEDGTDTGSPGDGSENDQGGDDSEGDSSSSGDNSSDNSSGLTWERVKQAYNKIMSGSWGNGVSHRVDEGKKDGYTEAEVRKAQELVNLIYGGKSMSQAKSALGFDTGGYTGDWSGSYGKLAFLHKKELILKQGDTENFLASMEILERILQMIDLQATSAQLGGILTTPKFSHYNDGVLEQNVHIEASFPGVTDHNEVELAMTNLINTASQYANRK